MAYKVPALRFAYDALEPYLDAGTMELHHDQHHQTYVDNLNKAIEPYPHLADLAIEDLLCRLDEVPDTARTAVRNHGGGHANHEFFWEVLGPNAGGVPKGSIGDALTKDFGSFARFQALFTGVAATHFGSGWVFLVGNPATGRLEIMSLPNQDSVLVHGKPGLLCCDVWEHAYYLKYRNRRADYLWAWWNVVAWDAVDERLQDFTRRSSMAPSKKASVRTTSPQQDAAGRYAAARTAGRQEAASASARDAQATTKQFAKTGERAIQAHIQARGQRQQARRDAR
jgi:superoxide dismutase, Fe-Mn family